MDFRSRSNRTVTAVGAAALAIHVVSKVICFSIEADMLREALDIVRYINDILVFLLWGVSIYWRVVQKHIRRALFAIVGIETFWLALRTVKYMWLNDSELPKRYAWYLYYLPMLMLPAMCLKLAIYLGKNESRSRRKKATLFPAISSFLFLIVITNDLHSLVFDIPPGLDGMEVGNYKYGIGFFIVLGYIAVSSAAALVLMYRNCRRLRKNITGILPLVPFGAELIVCVMNMAGVPHLDITFVGCFCVAASLEACLQTGIIQTNRGYRHIFKNSSIGLEIINGDLSRFIASDAYRDVSPDEKIKAIQAPYMMKNDIRLSASPIKYGYVLWQDDVAELLDTIHEIEEANVILEGKNEALQAEYISAKREYHLKEKNRLYNMLFDQSESYIRYYEELTKRLAAETDQNAYRELVLKIAYVSAFIKRRINIIFLDEEDKKINCAELKMCIEESLKILKLSGVECSCDSSLKEPMTFERITSLYENFYNFTAGLTGKISSIKVSLTEQNGSPVIEICMTGIDDLSDIAGIEKVKGEWMVIIK